MSTRAAVRPASKPTRRRPAPAGLRRASGRLRRSDCSGPGLRRERRGRGFSYLDERGRRIEDPEVLERIRELAIPPAWREVWICSDPQGHLQATGIDAAGRKQYLYHTRWREHRDRQKFDKMVEFGRRLPLLRRRLRREIQSDESLSRDRVLACAVRLLDVGMFRIGSEEYAAEESGIGLATIRKDHVSVKGEAIVFDYLAKGGSRRVHVIEDHLAGPVVRALKQRRGGGEELLAYRNGRRWQDVRSDEINDYIKRRLGEHFSAKDFRTWNATVLAAVSLAIDGLEARSQTARKSAINQAVRGVAELLGNTPAVARRAYIDPRVFDRYLSGWTIAGEVRSAAELESVDDRVRGRIERAVLDLLTDAEDSPALERQAEEA